MRFSRAEKFLSIKAGSRNNSVLGKITLLRHPVLKFGKYIEFCALPLHSICCTPFRRHLALGPVLLPISPSLPYTIHIHVTLKTCVCVRLSVCVTKERKGTVVVEKQHNETSDNRHFICTTYAYVYSLCRCARKNNCSYWTTIFYTTLWRIFDEITRRFTKRVVLQHYFTIFLRVLWSVVFISVGKQIKIDWRLCPVLTRNVHFMNGSPSFKFSPIVATQCVYDQGRYSKQIVLETVAALGFHFGKGHDHKKNKAATG